MARLMERAVAVPYNCLAAFMKYALATRRPCSSSCAISCGDGSWRFICSSSWWLSSLNLAASARSNHSPAAGKKLLGSRQSCCAASSTAVIGRSPSVEKYASRVNSSTGLLLVLARKLNACENRFGSSLVIIAPTHPPLLDDSLTRIIKQRLTAPGSHHRKRVMTFQEPDRLV